MTEKTKRNLSGFVLVFTFLGFFLINQWIQKQVKSFNKAREQSNRQLFSAGSQKAVPDDSLESAPVREDVSLQIIRRTVVEKGTDTVQNIFYKGDRVIARQIIAKNGKITNEGDIPNGMVKFYNQYDGSSGEEYYEDGRKNGSSKSYYNDGKMRSEARYLNDKLVSEKEFYNTGRVMMEVDYRDARSTPSNGEAGKGKLYYLDGKLKYEWSITNSNSVGYRRSYNPDGTLRAETFVDQYGNRIER